MMKRKWSIGPYGLVILCLAGMTENIFGIPTPEYSSANESCVLAISREDLINKTVQSGASTNKPKVSCENCKIFINLVQSCIKEGISDQEIVNRSIETCVSMNLQSAEICGGFMKTFGPEVIYIVRNSNLSTTEICSLAITVGCGDDFSLRHKWNVTFPQVPKPPIQSPIPPKEESPKLKVLHLSDYHYDPLYKEGSNARCNEPLCCRSSDNASSNVSAGAGRWGDYRCDTPKRTIDHMLAHISKEHPDIDYILWTGDILPHDQWNQTREGNLQILRDSVAQMNKTFPGKAIFPAVGNHDSFPTNSFPPPFVPNEYNMSWLYDDLNEQWKEWLPHESETIRRGAFYSVLVRPGLRIISLNSMYGYYENYWLLLNSTDPLDELQWLINELQRAETNNEKVHIIGHVPPGDKGCLAVWSRNYYEIVNRYESTIKAQFFGHIHIDTFELFYDLSNLDRALSIAYIGPSVTPLTNLNPGYRIYYVDGDHENTTRLVADHETWIMDLEEANRHDNPTWRMLYSAREAYNMSSLLPRDWNSFVDKMSSDRSAFDMFHTHFIKNSSIPAPCNEKCRKSILCNTRSGKSHDSKDFCDE